MPAPAKIIAISIKLLIVSAIVYFASRTYVDPDLWWHLKYGIDLWQSKTISTHDSYSFLTFNSLWIDHEWLFDVIIAFIYLHFGWFGLVAFKASLALLIMALIFYLLKAWQLDIVGQSLFLLVIACFLSPAINTVRPHFFFYIFLAILFGLLRDFPKHSRLFLLLPFMFLLWVNAHGGFIVGLLTLSVYALIYTFTNVNRKHLNSIFLLWAVTFFCWLTPFLNPYGIALPITVLKMCIAQHPQMFRSEWEPLPLLSLLGILWAAVTILAILSLNTYKGPKDIPRILLWLPFAAAPLVSIRHIALFPLATAILIGDYLIASWKNIAQTRPQPNKWGFVEIGFVTTSIIISLSLWFFASKYYLKPQIVVQEDIPDIAAGLLKKARIKGNLVVDFDWGGYAIWHLYPDMKVSFDGREEFAYPTEICLANDAFASGKGAWDWILNRFPVDAVLTRTYLPSYSLMKLKPGWELAYNNETSAIFLPSGSPQLLQIKKILSSIPISDRTQQLALPIF